MANTDIYVALEVGTTKVRVAVGEMARNGGVNICGMGEAPSRGVRKGEIVDIKMATECIRSAIGEAELNSDGVEIQSLCLAVTGGHVGSVCYRANLELPEENDEIGPEHIQELQNIARSSILPKGHQPIDSLLQRYYVDGNSNIHDPVGMCGQLLEGDFRIVHGVTTRLANTVKCVTDMGIEVEEMVFAPIAAGLVALDANQKANGALMIDLGGGTTGYVAYSDGVMRHTGVLAVGGDHVTNDMVLAFSLNRHRAEHVKKSEASAMLGAIEEGSERVPIRDETGYTGKEISREALNLVVNARLTEIFEYVRRDLEANGVNLEYLTQGIQLTGGGCALRGVDALAEEIFGLPVSVLGAEHNPAANAYASKPEYSTCIGLLHYMRNSRGGEKRGWMSRILDIFSL